MSDRTSATIILLGLACLLSGTALAAEPATQPEMYNGYTNRAPRTPTVSETANEITAKQAIGSDVQDANGAIVAKIGDLIADRKDGAVEAAILEPAGGVSFEHGRATVAWSSLKFDGKPTPHFVTALSRQALASGTSFKTAAEARNAYYDVKSDLLGKTAVGKDGGDLGHVKDLVFTFGDGKLVALVIDTGAIISVGAKDHAVAWDKANPEAGKGGSSVRLALTKQEVEAAPVTATMAPRGVSSESGNSSPEITRDSTGNISGTKIPAPPSRR
jgi:sporulation protein YlmC with PRC-barrel domain